MSVTPNALYYLNAWEAGAEVEGGMAHRTMLQKCHLDYSVASLGRIDAFLDAVRILFKPEREALLAPTENQNLLYFLAFYVGEVIGRALGAPPLWLSYEDATRLTPDHEKMFSPCFETSICCRYPDDTTAQVDFFTPLYALFTRLLSADSGKSILFSAGLFLPPASATSPAANTPTPALTPRLFGTARTFTAPDAATRRQHQVIRPWWADGHPILPLLEHAEHLLEHGRIVWGALVQANKALFEPEYIIGSVGDVIYDPTGRLPANDLINAAQNIFALKSTSQRNSALAAIANHLSNENSPVFGMAIPLEFHPQALKLSSTYFDQLFLPDGMLTLRHFPLLISDTIPGMVLLLPWPLWPSDFLAQWREASRSIHGEQIDSSDWKKRYDEALRQEQLRRASANTAQIAIPLYEEGLLYFHGRVVPQDFAQARQLWERAAELGEANSLNNLGILYASGLGVPPDQQKAIGYYRQAAEEGHALAQLNMGKTFLRESDSGITQPEARQWLQAAARQGNDEAISVLLRHFRQP